MLPFELLIGLRYTHAKRRNHFISFISIVAMAGIALGVMALIVVLSVMNGFQEELRTRILGVAAHLEISGPAERLSDWRDVLAQAEQNKDVLSGAPYVNAQGMLANGDMVRGAIIRGVLPEMESQVADFSQFMKAGKLTDLQAGEFGIILGGELARVLNVYPGDKLVLLTPQGNITPAGVMPRVKQFTVTGIFEAGMFEYDSGLALIHLQDAQKLLRLDEDVSGVRLKLKELFRAPFVTQELSQSLSGHYYLTDWTKSHANFFRAVAIEKRMMFLILLLIVAVAAFNIVSTLVMAVTDKQSDIAILRTLGAQPGSIMKIFMVQGSFIGVFGTMLGVGSGVLLALNLETVVPIIERMAGMDLFPADVYYINELPSKLVWNDVGLIAGISL
ncbi:MAG: lipoprotein-releasing ABC transporter permease subunit, partial [Thiobacillus sp.]